ncbi:unnamed protein product [Acanthosepion pharaonis]|uniref:Uncharacterized protein n=1 Tax=Acanthosepion pharaonis TaxID=158019 RepID=A0A812D4W9_ACAPH|nr:unnamed protein product [Sepia pharaonis]
MLTIPPAAHPYMSADNHYPPPIHIFSRQPFRLMPIHRSSDNHSTRCPSICRPITIRPLPIHICHPITIPPLPIDICQPITIPLAVHPITIPPAAHPSDNIAAAIHICQPITIPPATHPYICQQITIPPAAHPYMSADNHSTRCPSRYVSR